MRTATATAIAALAALAVVPAAQAGTPSTIGQGRSPAISVDPATGTAHIAWPNSAAGTLTYCRVPRGATACQITRTLAAPAPAVSGYPDAPFVLRVGANLVITMPVYATDKTYLWASANEGESWFGPTEIYDAVSQGTEATLPTVAPAAWPNSVVFGAGGTVWRSNGSADAALTTRATLTGGGATTSRWPASTTATR